MICHHCGRSVPRGQFCTVCGVAAGVNPGGGREQQYAAHPGENVAHPSVFSTLLPHLHPSRSHEFRLALAAGMLIVIVLGLTGFVAGALLAATVLVPSLYLVYMFEHRVYGDAPVPVLAICIGGGAVLGGVVMLIVRQTLGERVVDSWPIALLLDVALPLLQLVLIAAPALALRRRVGGPAVDGLTLGVASGLGFAAGEGLARFAGVFPVLSTRSSAGGWGYALVGAAALVPLIHGSCGGVLVAALWRRHSGHAGAWQRLAVPCVAIAAIGFYAGAEFLQQSGIGNAAGAAYQLVMIALVLVYGRYLLHHAMLAEATGLDLHALTCTHCGHHNDCAGFCPHCGAVTRHAVASEATA